MDYEGVREGPALDGEDGAYAGLQKRVRPQSVHCFCRECDESTIPKPPSGFRQTGRGRLQHHRLCSCSHPAKTALS